jgi:HEAT repeat protein
MNNIPTHIQRLIFIILVIAAILLVVDSVIIISILSEKISAKRSAKRRAEIREKIQQYITAWLMEEDLNIQEFMSKEIANYFSNIQLKFKLFREILYEEIFNANKVLLGDDQKKIKELYTFFGFEQKIKKEFFRYKWYKLVNATNDLLAIKALENSAMFTELLDHPNQFVRLVAIKAEISMGGDQVDILSEIHFPLSDWEMYEIISFLKRSQFKQIPNLSKLINHESVTLKILGLKLANIFQELDLEMDTKSFVVHPNPKVRTAIIEYLAECGGNEYLNDLKRRFASEEEPVKIAILKYVALHGTDDDVPFIFNKLKDAYPAIRVKAAETLQNMNSNSMSFLSYLESNGDKSDQKLAVHVLNKF